MEGLDDFHEGTWIHKYKGKYYLSYAVISEQMTHNDYDCMRYAISDHPLGPWK